MIILRTQFVKGPDEFAPRRVKEHSLPKMIAEANFLVCDIRAIYDIGAIYGLAMSDQTCHLMFLNVENGGF